MSATIKEVKAKYTDRLMAIEGVRSVGIGKDDNGNLAIIVGIERASATVKSEVPETLDGFPVIVQTVGDIQAE